MVDEVERLLRVDQEQERLTALVHGVDAGLDDAADLLIGAAAAPLAGLGWIEEPARLQDVHPSAGW